ncbi:MAG: aldehyde dehydrogenase family protein, partial [Chloroflexia bacterium]
MASVAEIFETLEWGPAPEAANPGLDWIKEHEPFGLFIDGEWRKPSGGKYFDSENPSTGKPLAKVAMGTSEDVDAAVAAAKQAFEGWSKTPGHVRARYLYAIARQVQKHSRLLAVLESMDNGKT